MISKEDEYFKNTCLGSLPRVETVYGGAERVDSVLCGLNAVSSLWVLVHDAARPLVSLADIEKLVVKVASGVNSGFCGGILACKVADTLKLGATPDKVAVAAATAAKAESADSAESEDTNTAATSVGVSAAKPDQIAIEHSVDRSHMYRAQTPQLFPYSLLKIAITKALDRKSALTDEASAMELMGHKVLLVEGSALNFKLTEPSDLLLARALLAYLK